MAGELPNNILLSMAYAKELDLRFVPGDALKGLETLKNLEKIVISSYRNEQETAGWEMLKQDYMKFKSDLDTIIYVKKNTLFNIVE